MTRTKTIREKYNITNGKELTMLYLRNDVLSLADKIQSFMSSCNYAFGNNRLYSYSTLSFTWKLV